MKTTLTRLRAILAINSKYATYSAIALSLVYILLILLDLSIAGLIKNQFLSTYVPLWVLVCFFLAPPVVNVLNELAGSVSGFNLTVGATKTIKRNLFVLIGIFWASGAAIVVSLALGASDVALVSELVGLLAWLLMIGIISDYVRTI